MNDHIEGGQGRTREQVENAAGAVACVLIAAGLFGVLWWVLTEVLL